MTGARAWPARRYIHRSERQGPLQEQGQQPLSVRDKARHELPARQALLITFKCSGKRLLKNNTAQHVEEHAAACRKC